jgi:hypothetical protein
MLPNGTIITLRIPKDSSIPYVDWFMEMVKCKECVRIIDYRDTSYEVETLSNNSISPYSQFHIRDEVALPVNTFKKF